MIRNANRNISVSKGHQYTVEKVKFAKDFINNAGRNTTLEDWVQAYNYIKGTNETAKGCQRCAAAKFTASVRNYAQYGYLTLINEGHTPDEFIDKVEVEEPEVVEVSEDTIEEVAEATIEKTTENACFEEKQANEVAEEQEAEEVIEPEVVKPKKVGRPKKKK